MRRVAALGLMVILVAVRSILADVVTLVGGSGYGPYQTGIGGEFTFQPDAGLSWILNSYNANPFTQTRDVLGLPNTFQTFCVEANEYISSSGQYEAAISQGSIYSYVPLTLGAAWLYDQFAVGTLPNYDYTRTNTATVQDLQTAIWYFMGQVAYDPQNQYIQLADTYFVTDANALAPSGGAYNVAILNLWTPNLEHLPANAHQDMLVIVPEPTSLTLLGLGLCVLVLLSRPGFFFSHPAPRLPSRFSL